jgi:hypothetical protein
MALPLCEGGERRGLHGNGPAAHDVCSVCAGSYRVKLDGTLIKHRPFHRPGARPTVPPATGRRS